MLLETIPIIVGFLSVEPCEKLWGRQRSLGLLWKHTGRRMVRSLDEDVVCLKAELPHSLNFMCTTVVLKLLFPGCLWEWA